MGVSSAAAGTAANVDDGEGVAEGVNEIESTKMDLVDVVCGREIVVIVGLAIVLMDDEVDVVPAVLLATTVRAVFVGKTAYC